MWKILMQGHIPSTTWDTLRRVSTNLFIYFPENILVTYSKGICTYLDEALRSRVQWNRASILVESHKLDPWPLDESPRPKCGKLRLNLHGTILEGKSIGSNQCWADIQKYLHIPPRISALMSLMIFNGYHFE